MTNPEEMSTEQVEHEWNKIVRALTSLSSRNQTYSMRTRERPGMDLAEHVRASSRRYR
jgi:hypothetical protein